MHIFHKNEESKQRKPWPSSLIYSLGFLPALDHQMPPYSVCVCSCPFQNTMNKIRFMPKAVQVNYKKIFRLKLRKPKDPKKNEFKRTKSSYLLTFSTHRENKPFEVGAEPRRRRAKCKTSSGNKTLLPGAVAVLKTPGAKGP